MAGNTAHESSSPQGATPIYLVDGSGYIFRAFYAVSSLSAPDGLPTNALFGFTRMLLKLMKQAASPFVAVTFDVSRETFRLDMYPEYKANRGECPADLIPQMPYFRHIVEALGLPVLQLEGYEADDVIGTMTKRLVHDGHEVVIVSGDKDLMQLVGPGVTVWDTLHDRRYAEEQVKEKFGVLPHKVVEVLALMGDSSDNIPGLEGVGPKTATQLIEKFGSVEEVIRSIAAISSDTSIRNRNKIAQALREQEETLRLSRKLVEIAVDAPVLIHTGTQMVHYSSLSRDALCEALSRKNPHESLLRELFERLNFISLLEELQPMSQRTDTRDDAKVSYKTVTRANFAEWLSVFSEQKRFAFDTETTSLDVHAAKLVGISVCWSDDEAFYIPVAHQNAGDEQVSGEEFIRATRSIWESDRILKVGQNLKYDLQIFSGHGLEVQGVAFDTMIAAYLLNPDRGSYNLTTLSEEYLGTDRLVGGRVIEFEEVLGEASDFSGVPIPEATRYACQDAHYAWLLEGVLAKGLEKEELIAVFRELEMPLVPVLARMERRGVLLDVEFLAKMSIEFAAIIDDLRVKIFKLADGEFNLNSPKQLSTILFEKLGLSTKGLKRTKTGISTDSGVLEKLAPLHPLPALLLRYRAVFKLKSTYVDALPAQVSAYTGRLHTRFNQASTGTGRLSSSDPNLQNIPIQSPEGARIREAFIVEPGWTLISADYSQIELRLLAHLSGDEGLQAAFKADLDIHAQTAHELLELGPSEKVTAEQRRIGKTMNFGIIYGMSGFRLARELGISIDEAVRYIESYFRRFPKVQTFFRDLEDQAIGKGFVRTILGRKRILSEIDRTGRDKGFAARVAVNAPIQGSAADVIKLAMVAIDRLIRERSMEMRLLLQIHDELVLECKQDILTEAIQLVREQMEGVLALSVPLKVDVGSGANWHVAH